jgi:octaprenyl-diphosphate synthase
VPVAAAVELLHTASLVHDDINDHSSLRRGQASVNAQWGDSLALLIGDFVFVRLLGLMASFDSQVNRVLARACSAIVEGETLQMLRLGDTEVTEEDYLVMVTHKTASLFSACTELGGILAGGTDEQVDALREYGLNLGIAFQIRDDTLDLVGQSDTLGKPVASDWDQGKISLAILHAMRNSEEARNVLLSKDRRRALQVLRETGALRYSDEKAREYSDKAKGALAVLPSSAATTELATLADFAVGRES